MNTPQKRSSTADDRIRPIPGDENQSSQIQELKKQVQDSHRLNRSFEDRLRFEEFLSEISSRYCRLPPGDVEDGIKEDLQRIGTFLGADRCHLALFTEDDNELRFIQKWTMQGLTPLPNTIANAREYWPWTIDQLLDGKIVAFHHFDELPDTAAVDRKNYLLMSIQSHLAVPIEIGENVVGTLNAAVTNSRLFWPEKQIQRLRLIGEIFVNALIRRDKELDIQQALIEIKRLKEQLEADCTYLREEIDLSHGAYHMIGESAAINTLISQIHKIAPFDTTVLIHGETGTGKELVARAIHAVSPHNHRPMVKVNCAALPGHLIENELFGHEKGAFTGAHARRVGRFELANGNTLFLDEIGELPLESQAKLLRVLQEGQFERIGGSRTIKVDVRIIAATHRDLEEEVHEGRFRRDLWYRLNVFPISVPPLRDHNSDIPLLAAAFIRKFNAKFGKAINHIAPSTMRLLQKYHWPGNVRELENVIERSVINSTGSALKLTDRLKPPPTVEDTATSPLLPLKTVERQHIIQALQTTHGKIYGPGGAAVILGLNPETLRTRMRKLNIKKSITIDG